MKLHILKQNQDLFELFLSLYIHKCIKFQLFDKEAKV